MRTRGEERSRHRIFLEFRRPSSPEGEMKKFTASDYRGRCSKSRGDLDFNGTRKLDTFY